VAESSGPQDACKTYVEQTKLLVALSSAFIVAPAAMVPLFHGEKALAVTNQIVRRFLIAEVLFVASVLAGYVVLATIAGFQHRGLYDVYRRATRIASICQIALYVVGLFFFVAFLRSLL
jgi:hypothetical protein